MYEPRPLKTALSALLDRLQHIKTCGLAAQGFAPACVRVERADRSGASGPSRAVMGIDWSDHWRPPPNDSMRARISSTRQRVIPRPSRTGFGNRPFLTPSHQVVFLTGINGGIGGLERGSPMICFKRRNPVSGSWFMSVVPRTRPNRPADTTVLL